MSLREELARRLVECFVLGNGGRAVKAYYGPKEQIRFSSPTNPDEFPKMEYASFLPVADECIRQMEWQRFQQWNWRRDWEAGVPFKGREAPAPLALAPEDWKP